MKFTRFTAILMMAFLYMGCSGNGEETAEANQPLPEGVKKMVAEEVIQGETYTYIRYEEDGMDQWMAIAKREVEEGKTYYYAQALPMANFSSKEINKDFDLIYFVSMFTETLNRPAAPQGAGGMGGQTSHGAVETDKEEGVFVAPAKGGMSIADIYGKSADLAGKTVTVRGQVTKVNTGIMGRNWVHIQDGTSHEGHHDLTVTTNGTTAVGDVVTFTGVIAINKDFGAGYKYDLIMERGEIK